MRQVVRLKLDTQLARGTCRDRSRLRHRCNRLSPKDCSCSKVDHSPLCLNAKVNADALEHATTRRGCGDEIQYEKLYVLDVTSVHSHEPNCRVAFVVRVVMHRIWH